MMVDQSSELDSPENPAHEPIRIDIVSDVVCPWCIIGYKQLEKAQAERGLPAVVYWHPFELNPDMADEGEDLFEHVAAKYGSTREQSQKSRERLTALGADLGFAFNYADDQRMVNTFRAHQLLHWASMEGAQHQLKMALFRAVFAERRNVHDPHVLAEIADQVGLDRDQALAILSDARFADQVRQHETFWTSRGVQGVPTIVFDGRYALVGAQGEENYLAMLDKVLSERVSHANSTTP
jgi:predicted DsbA family dithiol-disulfide isomerase